MYISSGFEVFSPSLYAVVGATGERMKSQVSNIFEKSFMTSVLTCNAFL